jgi:hypothetical protein
MLPVNHELESLCGDSSYGLIRGTILEYEGTNNYKKLSIAGQRAETSTQDLQNMKQQWHLLCGDNKPNIPLQHVP